MCCRGKTAKCVANPDAAPPDLPSDADAATVARLVRESVVSYEAAVKAACGVVDGTEYAYCDDSGDCAGGKRCCPNLPEAGEGTFFACGNCAGLEVCTGKGATCRTKGTVCVEGRCALPLAKRRCGATSCSTDKPVCCAEDPDKARVCGTRAECAKAGRAFTIECSGPRDCPGGVCQRNGSGQWCDLPPDPSKGITLCEDDQDCKSAGMCAMVGVAGRDSCQEGSCGCQPN